MKLEIRKPDINDSRSYKEIEKTFSYDWLYEEGKYFPENWFCYGTKDDNGDTMIAIYARENNLFDTNKGVEIEKIYVDERILNNKKAMKEWLDSFKNYISSYKIYSYIWYKGDIMLEKYNKINNTNYNILWL